MSVIWRALFLALASTLFLLGTESPATAVEAESQRIRAAIITGANNHDWKWTSRSLYRILMGSGKFDVEIVDDPATFLAGLPADHPYQVLVLDYNGKRWGDAAEKRFLETVKGGTGIVIIHAANNAFNGWVEYEKLVGLCWRKGTGHGRFHAFDVKVTDRDHPITRDLPDLKAHPDELYHRLKHMHNAEFRVIATAHSSRESGGTGNDEPMVTVSNYGEGRIFHTPLGHVWRNVPGSHASHRDPQFQDLVIRGTEWAATGDVTGDAKSPNSLSTAEREAGWQLLFDGMSYTGWRGFKNPKPPAKGWAIEDGALKVLAGGGGGDLITVQQFANFEFAFEWKVSPKANSGIIYRVSEDEGTTWRTGPEYQVLDDSGHNASPKTSAGALYGLYAPQDKILKPVGEFNHGRIILAGGHVEHWVNGVRVLHARLDSDDWKQRVGASKFGKMPKFGTMSTGHIALQDHGNAVWYRALKVRELSPTEVAYYDTELKPLFNGQDLNGWTFHLRDNGRMEDVWSVDDGVMVCKGKPVGYIRTEADYTNFILELKWRFDPAKGAGNSGVLFRMTGEDKVWPRSIEAQLHSGSAGDFWNIGNYPMKTDARRAGRSPRNTKHIRKNEHPIGQWNHYRIVVDGGDVCLTVNGEVLNRAWDCEVIPGKICLQSEGAEIHFKDIKLGALPTVD